MAANMDSIFEAVLAQSDPRSGQDVLVCAVHATLLSSGYSLTAVGDQDFGAKTQSTAELATAAEPKLPGGWNSSLYDHTLQYRHSATKCRCLLRAILMEGHLLVSAMVAGYEAEVFTINLEMSCFVKDDCDNYNTPSVFKNLLQLITTLNRDLEQKLSKICSQSSNPPATSMGVAQAPPTSSGRPHPPERADPLRVGPVRRPGYDRDLDPLGRPGPFGYGDSDRFPFIRGGPSGGMMFDPLRQGGGFGPVGPLPPNHPQGARYDPVFPVGPRPHPPGRAPGRSFGEPDPDHLPPPGYDDMFS